MGTRKGFKIGEVCKLLDIQPYVLRYWETEFVALHPAKSQSGQRIYVETEVAVIRRIKELLYDEGYTIAGAKKKLESRELELAADGPAATAKNGLFDLPSEEPSDPGAAVVDSPAEEQTKRPKRRSRGASASSELDTGSPDRIETFLRGVEEALAEARAALAVLEKHPR